MALKYPGASSLPGTGLSGGCSLLLGIPPLPPAWSAPLKVPPPRQPPPPRLARSPSWSLPECCTSWGGRCPGVCGSVGTPWGCVRGRVPWGYPGVRACKWGEPGGTGVWGILGSVCPRRDGGSPAWGEHPPQWRCRRDPDVSMGAPQGTQVPLSGTDPCSSCFSPVLPSCPPEGNTPGTGVCTSRGCHPAVPVRASPPLDAGADLGIVGVPNTE